MSMNPTHYVVLGYNLSDRRHLLDDDWKWTDEGEKWTCNASDGNIQVLLDLQDKPSLYFGYVLAEIDDYTEEAKKIPIKTILNTKEAIDQSLKEVGFPDSITENLPEYEMFILTNWS